MHPATELILARIESNPEEFKESVRNRWNNILIDLNASCPEEEWELVNAKIKAVRLDAVHQAIMQELCAPENPKPHKSISIMTTSEMKAKALTMLNNQLSGVK